MMQRRSLPCLLLLLFAALSCAPNDSDVGLSDDYMLESSAPEIASTIGPVLLRYEDQWTPLRCSGRTYREDDLVTVRISWTCANLDLNGDALRPRGAWEGALRDEDGDGTFVGNLFVVPMNANRSDFDLAAANVFPFTMTPIVEE